MVVCFVADLVPDMVKQEDVLVVFHHFRDSATPVRFFSITPLIRADIFYPLVNSLAQNVRGDCRVRTNPLPYFQGRVGRTDAPKFPYGL